MIKHFGPKSPPPGCNLGSPHVGKSVKKKLTAVPSIYKEVHDYMDLDDITIAISLMKIADKYNFSNLYDAIDSQLAQEIDRIIQSHSGKNFLKRLTKYVRFCEETEAPKLSAAIFCWKSNVRDGSGFSDREWPNLI